MQKITSLQAFVLRAPDGGRPHWVSNAIVSRGSELLLCLRTNAGIEGFGLATCSRGVAQVVEALRNGLADEILGESPLAPERLNEKLTALTSQRLAHEKGWGREALIRIAAAADIACWDIIGKIAGLPLYQLFGGYRTRVPLDCIPDPLPGVRSESGYFRNLSRRCGDGTEGKVDGGDHRLLA
jgi:L-alanine-DL-glutamate epimerase-like enolase superfamily enzyme